MSTTREIEREREVLSETGKRASDIIHDDRIDEKEDHMLQDGDREMKERVGIEEESPTTNPRVDRPSS